MRTVLILIDSLNRNALRCYSASENKQAFTPNIDRLAARSVVFDQHFCGSAPCMPARRDLMTGRLNFLERPWGGIEPFDHTLTQILRDEKNVYSHMETDHFHYSERGGENYWASFTSWRLHRGAEHDTINWMPSKDGIRRTTKPDGYVGIYSDSYESTRRKYGNDPRKYSTTRTLQAAADWLEVNHNADHFMLWAEAFDPHEPFDVPDEYLKQYGALKEIQSDAYWPEYTTADQYTEADIEAFRIRYKALLTMTDNSVGKILDVLDRNDMWKDTMVILTTDHGYLLGEHGFMAKNYMPDYNEIHHIPLMISYPGHTPGRRCALTENIDLFPTILEAHGVDMSVCRNPIHGKSLLPVLKNAKEKVRDELIFGVFGKTVSVYDGRYVYSRAKTGKQNEPLYIYGAMMSVLNEYIGLDTMSDEEIDHIEMGRFLSWTNYPVYRVHARDCHWSNESLKFSVLFDYVKGSKLYDIQTDPDQMYPLEDKLLENEMIQKLIYAMKTHDAPKEQFIRLGLSEQFME